jgi:hypothetical protein
LLLFVVVCCCLLFVVVCCWSALNACSKGAAAKVTGTAKETNPEELADVKRVCFGFFFFFCHATFLKALVNAKSVMIVPGYGLAVAKAQYAVADIIKHLTAKVNEGVVFWWLKKETRA